MTEELKRNVLAAAETFAREAGEITLRYFRAGVAVETKSDDSPVTIADREAEAVIRSRIHSSFPTHGVLGEEGGYERGNEPVTWIVDPIDGTKSFIAGIPLYTVLVAVVEAEFDGTAELPTDRVIAGVIHAPATDETVSAARGLGATWRSGSETSAANVAAWNAGEPSRVGVSGSIDLPAPTVLTTDWVDLARRFPDLARNVERVAGISRTWGDAYGYLLLATGRAHAMIDPIMNPWDVGPIPVIVEEAGGEFFTLERKRVIGSSAVATVSGIADKLDL